MKDIPIIFSAPMVRALLDGRKTMTRRLARRYPKDMSFHNDALYHPSSWVRVRRGDRLWVRETWAHYHTVNHIRRSHGNAFDEISDGLTGYRADGHYTIEEFRQHVRLMSGADLESVSINGDRWRPAIHMPRWASRITNVVTTTKAERLNDITDADAIAEGVVEHPGGLGFWVPGVEHPNRDFPALCRPTPREMFAALWDVIHGSGAWLANPEVVALSLSVHHKNIDAVPMEMAA